jgi:hypothetical protein
MGNAHPFYRFSPANINGGFEPGYSLQSFLTRDFIGLFSDGDFVTAPIQESINTLKNQLKTLFNNPEIGGDLTFVYPKPYPAITGVQTLVFYVQNNQLISVDSTQRGVITFELSDGIITDSTFVRNDLVSALSTYDDPILDIELLVKRALEIYYQNGSAIFPITYSFDRTTGIATSSIARGKDWKVDLDTGVVGRYPAQTNPFAPVKSVTFSALNPSQNYVLSLIERIISFTIADQTLTASELIALVNGLHLPDDYTLANTTDSSGATERVSILFTGERSFLLIARTEGSFWYFQRFVIDDSTPINSFLADYAIATDLPYEPLTGQLFVGDWYDLDLIQFNNGCEPEDLDTFQMPIKTGDTYQFNIIPEQANLTGLISCQIGLFDENLNFVSEIGTATFPHCKLLNDFTVTIPEGVFGAWVSALSGQDTIFDGVDCNGATTGNVVTVPAGSTSTGSITAYADSIIAYINLQDGLSASYVFNPDLVFTIVIEDLTTPTVQISIEMQSFNYDGDVLTRCPDATQFQATVTIPSAPDGCYVFGLYDDNYPYQSIFAFSNSLEMNNQDCFSSMWQFGSSEDAIIEGFEYYSGWMQRLRLPINGAGQKPKIEESIYRNSDGTYQRPSNYSDLTLDLHSDYLDLETRNAVFSATRCPILIFEDQSIFVSGDLDVATVQDFSNKTSYRKLAQMKFSALIQGFQPDNNGCIGC